jgi:hypothetical protein
MPDSCSTQVHLPRGKPSGLQRRLAAAVLAGLVAIAAGIVWTQSRFNPAVDNFLKGAAGQTAGQATAPASREPILPLPAGMSVLTPAERFEPASLSDKIDGKAELYLSAGFVRLDCQRFALAGGADLWIEAFVYDMGSFENAYAVFSAQRRSDGTPLDFAEFAYRAENAVFFVHGPTYLELIAAGTDERLKTAMDALARAFIASRAVARKAIGERELFPKSGLTETSISLIPADAFGLAGLDRVFTATYTRDGKEMTAFLSRRADPKEAATLAGAYVAFLKAYGGEAKGSGDPVPGAATLEVLDMVEVVFSEGPFLAGVHEAADRDQALRLARELAARLKEASDAL